MPPHRSANNRRFSYGGDAADLADVVIWKFDVQTEPGNLRDSQFTAYVRHAARGDAFRTLFAQYPSAKVFGTGLPLSEVGARSEIGRLIDTGEVFLVDDL